MRQMTSVGAEEQAVLVLIRRGPQLAAPAWQELLSGLPLTERRRIEGLGRWEDRQDSAMGWQLLHQLAAERGVSVKRNVNGRPWCEPPVDLSLSHAGGWIAVAAGEGGRIGVDVETLRAVAPSLARRCLSAAELAWVEQAPRGGSASLRFFQLWTAKEAYLKATGWGLAVDPREIYIDYTGDEPKIGGPAAGRWRLSTSQPAPGVCVTVCVERTP